MKVRKIFVLICVVLLIGCFSSCKSLSNNVKNDGDGATSIKPEGDVFLYIEKMFSKDVMQMDDEISIKISYGCNLSNEMIPEGTSARFVISSDQVNIKDNPILYDDISDGKCARDKELTYMFSFPTDNIMCNAGNIKFEIQLINEAGEIFSFCNKDIYFASKDKEIYLDGVCMEEAADYLAKGHDIYYDSIQGADFFDICFWFDNSEELIYFLASDQQDREVWQYSYEMNGKDLLVKDENGQVVCTIEYVQKDEMKINDKVFYHIDEDLW